MYDREEKKLASLRQRLDTETLPLEQADAAILQGMERAKREKRMTRVRKKRTLWTLAAAAVLILAFATSIRVSPAFANAVAVIPGLEKFVELIEQDKGLSGIFKNDYYQAIGASEQQGNHTLTIDGVILDGSGMNVYYTIESSESLEDIQVKNARLKNTKEIPPYSMSLGGPHDGKSPNRYTDHIEFYFEEPMVFDDLAFGFELSATVSGEEVLFSVPFTVPEDIKPSLVFALDEVAEIEGQKIIIEEVIIHPLRAEINISLDPTNSMKILQFEDMRLEDENGNVWGSMLNGFTSTGNLSEGTVSYLLQSNYFEQPGELYLRFNTVQALPVEEAFLVIDTEKGELISGPKDARFSMEKADQKEAIFALSGIEDEAHRYGLTTGIEDAEGKRFYPSSESMSTPDNEIQWTVEFGTTDYTNPLRLELFAYPNRIKGDVKVELKNPRE
ncbi:hypothetical protein BN1080_00238 [Planococcus massiliensis]|uniref:DUF4179 domain-containing protein n=1 Tax=Planococcus massiliensis TaxID=1499687 RepID=A0A098EJ52_9BACL|nr:DUF4179 domain-containing protein [Planococcus massiliensis]CEG21331.1 hypothetical protein BN1080_00238 [Planococcus massiliensis]